MKTILPKSIETIADAKKFLTELQKNGEAYHPEDDATTVVWQTAKPTRKECKQLNKLMQDIYSMPENYRHMNQPIPFDPCAFLHEIQNPLRRGKFQIDGIDQIFEGYTDGTTWNGWDCPLFEWDVASQIIKSPICNNETSVGGFASAEGVDEFWLTENDEEIQRFYPCKREGMKLYEINNGWTWSEVIDQPEDNSTVDGVQGILEGLAFEPFIKERHAVDGNVFYTVDCGEGLRDGKTTDVWIEIESSREALKLLDENYENFAHPFEQWAKKHGLNNPEILSTDTAITYNVTVY